jgi:hypothetical protein
MFSWSAMLGWFVIEVNSVGAERIFWDDVVDILLGINTRRKGRYMASLALWKDRGI